ncbi:MAG: hypothetical protein Fur0032_06170 [Terrimicrobiaceae bacterium]
MKRLATLLIALMAATHLIAADKDADIDWDTDVYPQGNIFPSFIIGTARVDLPEDLFAQWEDNHIGDPQGSIGIVLTGTKAGQKIRLTVAENDLMEESVLEETLEEDADGLLIHPKIHYKYDALAAVTQAKPFNISMQLEIDGKSVGKKVATATLRPINDCLFGVEENHDDGETTTSDYSWLFSAYVNENHPWVDRILKEALETRIVDSFTGYQSGDPDQVLLQIFAIWNVMQRRGLRYSDITTTSTEDDGVYSQHVRLFDQSLDAAQANCVDGTVLLAALLRKIGLHPYLILVPGHMYLAVGLDEETTIGIETTLMGSTDLPRVGKDGAARFQNLDDVKNETSWESFEAAVAVGTEDLEKNADEFDSDSLSYQVIDLATARSAGILPLSAAPSAKN